MQNKRGEIATIITIAAFVILGISTVASSFVLKNKTQTTSSKAAEAPGTCRDNPVAPPTGYTWKVLGDKQCINNSQCPRGADNQEGWCYGFEGPKHSTADWRCLQLMYGNDSNVNQATNCPGSAPGAGAGQSPTSTPAPVKKLGDKCMYSELKQDGSTKCYEGTCDSDDCNMNKNCTYKSSQPVIEYDCQTRQPKTGSAPPTPGGQTSPAVPPPAAGGTGDQAALTTPTQIKEDSVNCANDSECKSGFCDQSISLKNGKCSSTNKPEGYLCNTGECQVGLSCLIVIGQSVKKCQKTASLTPPVSTATPKPAAPTATLGLPATGTPAPAATSASQPQSAVTPTAGLEECGGQGQVLCDPPKDRCNPKLRPLIWGGKTICAADCTKDVGVCAGSIIGWQPLTSGFAIPYHCGVKETCVTITKMVARIASCDPFSCLGIDIKPGYNQEQSCLLAAAGKGYRRCTNYMFSNDLCCWGSRNED